MNLPIIIEDVQQALGITTDGKAGPETWLAIWRKLCPPSQEREAVLMGLKTDPRSEGHIITLHPQVQPMARALVHLADEHGICVKVIDGSRSYDEQDALYAKGRTPGDYSERVTNARGGESLHNFGIAFDVGVFDRDGTRYLAESPAYKAVGLLGQSLGLEWGGNWQTITDEPHFQLRPQWAKDISEGQLLQGLRGRVALGKDVFAA